MTARYEELSGGTLSTPAKKPAAKPGVPLGGSVANADGGRTVITYRQDASGNKVPVTTDYDRNGRVLRRTTVDGKGQTVPLP